MQNNFEGIKLSRKFEGGLKYMRPQL